MVNWAFAVSAADRLVNAWPIQAFENNTYHLRIYGPNGFFREFCGNVEDPAIEVRFEYERSAINKKKLTGNVELRITNTSKTQPYTIEILDHAYKTNNLKKEIKPSTSKKEEIRLNLDLRRSSSWYDFSIRVNGYASYEKRYAGRVETGKHGSTDPFMGRVVS